MKTLNIATAPDWANDLPVRGDGYSTSYYVKK